jgi:nitroreductase
MLSYENWKQLTQSRRSTRDFLDSPIEPGVLTDILTDGLTAPSWSNTRPFVVAVAEGEQRDRISQRLIARLRESTELPNLGAKPDFTHEIPYPKGLAERSQAVGKGIYDTLGIDRKDTAARFSFLERNYEFFGAPTALFFFTHRGLDQFGTLDLGLFMENVMLAANAKGLGTCAQGYLGGHPDIIRSEFEVSDDYALVCGMSIGYPSEHPINGWHAERLPITDLLLSSKKQ